MIPTTSATQTNPAELAELIGNRVRVGGRFAGLIATARNDGSTVLRSVVASRNALEIIECVLAEGETTYPAITPHIPAAAWYEREIHDLFGIVPSGHPRLDPLVLPLRAGDRTPRPGSHRSLEPLKLNDAPLPGHVSGEGVFTIPYGPVRSGVFESVEYLVETPGEEIPHLRTRIYHKHRGLDRRFEDLSIDDAVLLAERVEGTSSVAHAIALCQSLESLAGVKPSLSAELVRVVHAELERIAVHLDSIVRHTEGAGQAIAYARMSVHKEAVLRLRAKLCGNRFGRGVAVPGGVRAALQLDPKTALAEVSKLEAALTSDATALMETSSFLDRLRGTGPLSPEYVAAHGALGPVARGSGFVQDVRLERPYGGYQQLRFEVANGFNDGDALARQYVRLTEIRQAFQLICQALDELAEAEPEPWHKEMPSVSGLVVSSVEAPQGELIYLVEVDDDRFIRVKARTASFHNLAIFPEAFQGDIFTDFVFIEASFGLSIAGAAG